MFFDPGLKIRWGRAPPAPPLDPSLNRVPLIFCSVLFDWLRREKFTALQPDRKPGLFSDDLGNEKACFIMS